jgi:AcrR family transcriptional regulator
MATRAAGQALTRDRILHAARDLYLSRPFDQVTIREIARAAAVSIPTVLLHFGSKDRLVSQLVKLSGPIEDALRETPPGDVEAAARVLVQRYEDTGQAVLRLLALEERFPVVAEAMEEGRRRHRGWVERTFTDVIAARPAGPVRQRLVSGLVAAYDVYTWRVLRNTLSVEDTISTMADLATGLIGTFKGAGDARSAGDVGRRRYDSTGTDDREKAHRPRPRRARPGRSHD